MVHFPHCAVVPLLLLYPVLLSTKIRLIIKTKIEFKSYNTFLSNRGGKKMLSNQKTNKCHDIPWDENFIVQPYLNKQFSITQAHSGSKQIMLESETIEREKHFLKYKKLWEYVVISISQMRF